VVGLFVCLSVGHVCESYKNDLTGQDVVWWADLGGPKEPSIRWGSRLDKSVCHHEW